jgi:hypothetical protein
MSGFIFNPRLSNRSDIAANTTLFSVLTRQMNAVPHISYHDMIYIAFHVFYISGLNRFSYGTKESDKASNYFFLFPVVCFLV